MAGEASLDQVRNATSSLRVTTEDPDGGAPLVRDVASDAFETTERGVFMGPLFVPWHRVIRYHRELRQEFVTAVGEAPSKARIRIRVDDGSPSGNTIVVAADRFEGGPWTISMLVDRHVEPEQGVLVVDKVFIPWSRVIEYERLPIGRTAPPARPDLSGEGADAQTA
jgi:hypothetical protein